MNSELEVPHGEPPGRLDVDMQVSLMRLPRHIREMSIGQFKVKYQGTVSKVHSLGHCVDTYQLLLCSKVNDEHMGQVKQLLDTPRQMQLRSRTIACTPSSKKKMVTPGAADWWLSLTYDLMIQPGSTAPSGPSSRKRVLSNHGQPQNWPYVDFVICFCCCTVRLRSLCLCLLGWPRQC